MNRPAAPSPTELPEALRFSRHLAAVLGNHPEAAIELAATLGSPFEWTQAEGEVTAAATGDAGALDAALRLLRRRCLLHTAARDLGGRADLAEVCAAMTRLAQLALRAAIDHHHRALADVHGEPLSPGGQAQQLVVVGMGKLGGGELNVSSDIDLVFLYPEEGETAGPRRIANGEFFDRLGRRIIAALHDRTPDGYVFRVDMRLRPYGDSGPLTGSFAALENYLVTQGRTWERYAWLKARALTGSRHDELAELVTPFVYRKYLDYDAYEGLRDVHAQIREQGRRRDYQANIKQGPGGIREIEFTVQALQLVRGGREPALRQRGTLPALAVLASRGLMPGAAAAALKDAYVFLRNLEHRLQYRDDEQTQTLPAAAAERDALARAMGFDATAPFEGALARHRAAVEEQFAAIFGAPPRASPRGTAAAPTAPAADAFAAIWRGEVTAEAAEATLANAGFADAAALAAALGRVRGSARYAQLPALSSQRFDALLPQLLATASSVPVAGADPQTVFERLLALLETVSRRSAYLALLIEHPPLLPRLAQLMGASAWAAEQLTAHPILLDELLDARILLAEPDWSVWRADLSRALADHEGDTEHQMDALRHFQHAQSFRLLAQDLAGLLTVERLADHLSALADIVLAATLAEVWRQIEGADAPPPRFAIVGYGKLGGKELGYASDLDLVFVFEGDAEQAPVRYARLARRLISWLTSTTAAGALYDIDMRLRPDGASGLPVSSLASFCRYQREKAWTWEHQALTRARFVAGDPGIGAAFEAEREAILRLARDPARLAADVIEMRRKLWHGHPNPTPEFDLKHDRGGMVDVEFAVQYLVLAHAHDHAILAQRRQHRSAGFLRRARTDRPRHGRRRGRRVSRVPPAAAPDPAAGRRAGARRPPHAARAARRGGGAVVGRLRRGVGIVLSGCDGRIG
jgi:glutamate-ammonia-ligase adenylyltransferase